MSSRSWLGFVTGVAIGATAALLLAPHKGKDTRRRIKVKAKDLGVNIDKVEHKVDVGIDKVSELAHAAMDSLGNYTTRKAQKKDGDEKEA
ncbi:YtxH domain-containing protein [uncultured Microscilla sp.]|uniref:YtxH domain-containing protein n=1 Tax=uncultured Microscilla sp. TaxID=432653 RepID=UPI00260B63C4|nr:YtxH domain-containing protein [uncultured Microscilla sp.]